MSGDAQWKINVKTEEAKAQVRAAMLAGITEVFQIDIREEAIRLSPYQTGTNRRSIDTEVTEQENGIQAQLFSQSGYGGYLETGTVKMKAQPYLWPAFNKFIGRLSEIIGQKVKAIKPGMFIGPAQKPEE